MHLCESIESVKNNLQPITKTSYSLSTLVDMVEGNNELELSKEPFTWSLGTQSLWVESILLRLITPPIILIRLENNVLSLIKGNKKLKTLMSYMHNEFGLEGCLLIPGIEGTYFKDLSLRHKLSLNSYEFNIVIIPEGMKSVWERYRVR